MQQADESVMEWNDDEWCLSPDLWTEISENPIVDEVLLDELMVQWSNENLVETWEEVSMRSRDDWYLPPEMWIEIFRHLNAKQLLPVRLTCRRWRDIVDGSSLLRRISTATFPVGTELDGDYEPKFLMPARMARFNETSILALGTWWSAFAANLAELHLTNCEGLFPTFLEMLRLCPDLRRLELSCVDFTAVAGSSANFQLDRMEYLSITDVNVEMLQDVFAPIFPRLRKLSLPCEGDDDSEENQKIVHFIEAVQDTLESFGPCSDINLLTAISRLPRLKLKHVSCNSHRAIPARLVEICRMQSSIEELELDDMRLTDTTLIQIGRNLPKLKRIQVKLALRSTPMVASFLKAMPKIECLSIKTSHTFQRMNFSRCRCPLLKKLHLENMQQTQNSWSFLKKSPNLREITLHNCLIETWPDIFVPFSQLQHLRCLKLLDVQVRNNSNICTFETWNSLTSLSMEHCNTSSAVLVELFLKCPQLRDLNLRFIDNLDDGTMLVLCQELKYLNNLTVEYCRLVGNAAVMHAMNHCHALAKAQINDVIIR